MLKGDESSPVTIGIRASFEWALQNSLFTTTENPSIGLADGAALMRTSTILSGGVCNTSVLSLGARYNDERGNVTG